MKRIGTLIKGCLLLVLTCFIIACSEISDDAVLSEFMVPEYFIKHIVEKEKQWEEYVKMIADGEKLSYVFFSDAHWGHNQKHSPAIIKHIVNYTSIDQVIFGGDANTSRECQGDRSMTSA